MPLEVLSCVVEEPKDWALCRLACRADAVDFVVEPARGLAIPCRLVRAGTKES